MGDVIAMGTPKLSLQAVGKRFPDAAGGGLEVLRGIDLEMRDNEFVTLVGASGCGKSTLLRIVAGLEIPSAGQVLLNGKAITGPGADRGMVFQHYTLYPWLTVFENLRFSRQLAANRGRIRSQGELGGIVDRGYALLEMMGLTPYKDAYPHQLSGGMQQRVAIARALLSSPEVLLMDEPFGALDAQTREVMHDLILHLFAVERGTVLFVTHDVEEAAYLADRVVVLAPKPGRIDVIFEMPWGPRREQGLKLTPDFVRMKGEILARIRATSGMQTDFELLERLTRAQPRTL